MSELSHVERKAMEAAYERTQFRSDVHITEAMWLAARDFYDRHPQTPNEAPLEPTTAPQ